MQVTEVEYKTKEKEVTRYKCDNCGYVGDEEEFSTLRYYEEVNPSKYDVIVESQHRCETCSGVNERIESISQKEYIEEFFDGAAKRSVFLLSAIPALISGYWSGYFGLLIRQDVDDPIWFIDMMGGTMAFALSIIAFYGIGLILVEQWEKL